MAYPSGMEDFDLVVLGSGPAGEKGAAQAAYFGKRVALVEREPAFGGAAANTGTLPSKTLRETALSLSGFRARGLYGVDLSLRREATVRDFLHREAKVVDVERARVGANLDRHNVRTFSGPASFVDPHTGGVGGKTTLKARVVLLATGSSPRRPPEFPAEHPHIYDSDSILRLDVMPKRLIVVGAGVIGCEYACTFAALGADVHLVDGRDVLLPFLDREMSAALKEAVVRLGVKLVVNEKVKACRAGAEEVELELGSGLKLKSDAVLVAAGRVSNTAGLNLAAA
jgi:NAD(P) transhydrogenase